MEASLKPVEIFNLVRSIVHQINFNNFNKMAQKIISIPKKTIYIFENIVNIIYFQALNRPNFTVLYAKLCAYMANNVEFNKLHNSKTNFQKILAQKSFDMFTSYYTRTPQKEVHNLKEKFMNSNMTPSNFKNSLNTFHFQYYNKSLTHCKFIGELFKQGAFTEKNILSFINELMKVKDILNIHCLCIILQIAGQKLSKTHNLDGIVNHILLFKNENTVLIKMSPTLQSLIFKIQNLYLKCCIHEEPLELIEDNKHYNSFENLPEQLKKPYEFKSYTVMAQCIIDECMVVLNDFDKKSIDEIIHSLNNINSWIHYDQVSFVTSMILITLNEDQSIRHKAGILLNEFVTKGLLLIVSILSGVDKVMDDSELNIELPRLSDLLFDITSRLTYLDIN